MLNFDGSWRFDSPGEIPQPVIAAVSDLIGRFAAWSALCANCERECESYGPFMVHEFFPKLTESDFGSHPCRM
jgi:hypothetical protein